MNKEILRFLGAFIGLIWLHWCRKKLKERRDKIE